MPRQGPWPVSAPLVKATSTWTPVYEQWLSKLVENMNAPITLTTDVTGVLPVVNGGTGNTIASVPAANLTGTVPDAALSTNVPLKNGTNAFTGANSFATNVVDLLVGQLKFPAAQNPSANVNTLDDYEEGTWTPTDASGAGLTFTVFDTRALKWGQGVVAWAAINYPVTASALPMLIGGLPFVPQTTATLPIFGGLVTRSNLAAALTVEVSNAGASTLAFYTAAGAIPTNAALSNLFFVFVVIYRATA